MKKIIKKDLEEIYEPKEIRDTNALKIEKYLNEKHEERKRFIRNYFEIKKIRIQQTEESRETHTINTIIKWANASKNSIPFLYFNYFIEELADFSIFLNQLKTVNGMTLWEFNKFKDIYHTDVLFENINIPNLEQYRDYGLQVLFSPGQTVIYQNNIVFFKVGDGGMESIDFSKAPQEREAFETFWMLHLRNPGKISFSQEEINSTYSSIHNKIVEKPISRAVSAIRKRIKDKELLSNRLVIKYDKTIKRWFFSIE